MQLYRALHPRFPFGSVSEILNLAAFNNSPDRSTKSTTSRFNALCLLVNTRFQVLFTFPSRYWFTIGHVGVFSLSGWSRMLPTRFHVPRRTQDSTRSAPNFDYGACTLFGGPFNVLLLSVTVPHRGPTTPALRLVWALPRSLAATEGIIVIFFSSRY